MKNCVEITGVDMKKFVKKVYDLSQPQGLGMLHFTPEPMSDELAEQIVGIGDHNDMGFPSHKTDGIALRMDYVGGRACKMTVHQKEGKLFIPKAWYDHTDSQLKKLLEHCGINEATIGGEHGCACNCNSCISERGHSC